MSGETRTPAQPADARVLLTSREAADLLCVSVDTLLAMPVPYVTIGTGRKRPRRRYLRATLVAWAKKQEVA